MNEWMCSTIGINPLSAFPLGEMTEDRTFMPSVFVPWRLQAGLTLLTPVSSSLVEFFLESPENILSFLRPIGHTASIL